MATLELSGLRKSFGETHVLHGVDLTLADGEMLVIVGASGCGKSTLLRLVAGLEQASAGRILLDERDITGLDPSARDIAMVFQNYALYPHMSVFENMAYGLRIRGLSKTEIVRKVDDAAALLGLGELLARKPRQLSGGQRQRVALARALVFDPQLVLMDEPLGALDKQLREHMQIELKELHRRLGVTFVYVTHDQSEALTMSDRVAVFHDGLIQQIDGVETLYETPVNRFVASFVGDSTVLDGQIEAVNGNACTLRLPNGVQLQGVNVNQAKVGEQVQCGVRPERLQVAEAAGPNTFEARMLDLIYFGDHLRVRCEVAGQEPATIKMALAHAALPQPGQTFQVYAPPEHLRVYR